MDTQTFRKFCPVCKLDNDANATICEHCSTPVIHYSTEAVTTRRVEYPFELTDEIREQVTRAYIPPSKCLSFFLLNKGEPIALRTEEEFVLGRVLGPTSEPIMDLTEFDGFAMGVSRRHAMIQANVEKYMLTDLNSSNGTWINGHRLVPTKSYELPNGAVIQLGRIKLVVSYIDPPQKNQVV